MGCITTRRITILAWTWKLVANNFVIAMAAVRRARNFNDGAGANHNQQSSEHTACNFVQLKRVHFLCHAFIA